MTTLTHITTSGGLTSVVFIEIIGQLGTRQWGIEELTPTLVEELALEARAQVEKLFSDLIR